MRAVITNKFFIFFASLMLTFGVAFSALAYENLEIEIDVKDSTTEVEVEYTDGDAEVDEEYEYNTTDLEEVYVLIAAELDITVQAVKDAIDEDDEEGNEMEQAEEAIADAEEAINDLEDYISGLDASSTPTSTIEELEEDLAEAKALLEEAETAFANEDYEEAEEKADEAEDIVEAILGDDDDDDDDEEEDEDEDGDDKDKDTSKFCDKTKKAAGWGVAKKCASSDGYVINDKLASKIERFADFGKSNDKVVLQGQLRDLLLLLIELLQAQQASQ